MDNDDLAERLSTVDGSKIHSLKSQLHDCSQAKGTTATTYFGQLKALWDVITCHEPPFACTCGRCLCGITKDALARQDSEWLHKFLMGLDRSLYGNLRSQLLSLDPLPTLTRAFQLALQEERLCLGSTTTVDPTDVMTFAVRPGASSVPSSSKTDWRVLRDLELQERKKLVSSHCIGTGHEISACFIRTQKFPDWWGDRPRTVEEVQARARARSGSTASSSSSARANMLISEPASDRFSGMSPDWIIDTGASHHVTGDVTWLSDSRSISPRPITLPNGHSVLSKLTGTVWLNNSLQHTNVLYVPSITCNLLSVSQLVAATGCAVSFTNNSCHIQAPSLKTRIGVGETDGVTPNPGTPDTGEPVPHINEEVGGCEDVRQEPGNTAETEPRGRGHILKIPSTRLRGFVLGTTNEPTTTPSSPDSSASSSSSGTPYTLTNYINCNKFSANHRHFLAALTAGVEPPSFRIAITDSKWCKAMQDEITTLENNDTRELTELPPNKKALGCRWVYKIKYKSDGQIERYKARLVIFGNHQVEGIDFGDTFAPVVKMVTIRTFLAVAAVKKWELHQMDVRNAFLHGDLSNEFYMRLPPGYSKGKEGKVCRLRKSLYGLRQAPRCWFAKLGSSLRTYGFIQSYSHYSLFSYAKGEVRIHVLVYVDDLLIVGNDKTAIASFKSYLGSCFHMKDLSSLKYFLGIEVARTSEGIFLNQRKYALDIISESGLLGAKPAATPIEQHHQLGLAKGDFVSDVEAYRRLVGRLVYLAVTRPDLAYAKKKQQTVSLSSDEAEYRAMVAVLCELKWLMGPLSSLGVPISSPIKIFSDSQSAIQLAQNPVFHERTKHIEVDCHFIRDAVNDGLVAPFYVDTRSQTADIFTKALGSVQLDFLLRKLGVLDLHALV
ncbi:uncharacterized protein LOC141628447 [Silene latifolia]|uniref:uncharacterized protein LOC141628447 n=1 Tax=Silene latifolia TaxID=37657 RepID=UPI003D78A294